MNIDIDLNNKIAKLNNGIEIQYEYLINSIPFDKFLRLTNNKEYINAYNRYNNYRNDYDRRSYDYNRNRRYDSNGCCCCCGDDCCSDLCTLYICDSCCECFGGDLCTCF